MLCEILSVQSVKEAARMKVFEKISDTLYRIEKCLAIILMTVMLLSIALGVIFRYFLNNPLTWSDELAVYMLIWLTFVGGSMSLKTGRAASLDLVFDRMSILWKRIFLVIGFATISSFGIIGLMMAIKWISAPTVLTTLSPGLKISMFLPYLAVPFGFACLTIHALVFFIKSFTYTVDSNEEGGDNA